MGSHRRGDVPVVELHLFVQRAAVVCTMRSITAEQIGATIWLSVATTSARPDIRRGPFTRLGDDGNAGCPSTNGDAGLLARHHDLFARAALGANRLLTRRDERDVTRVASSAA